MILKIILGHLTAAMFGGTLPETNIFAPENGWLEYYFSFWEGLFSGAMLVLGSVKVGGAIVIRNLRVSSS